MKKIQGQNKELTFLKQKQTREQQKEKEVQKTWET